MAAGAFGALGIMGETAEWRPQRARQRNAINSGSIF